MDTIYNFIVKNANNLTWLITLFYALVPIIGGIYIKRIELNFNRKNQRIIEDIKSENTRNQHILEQSISSLTKSNELLMVKSTQAIEELWSIIQEIHMFSNGMITTYSILLEDEYRNPKALNKDYMFNLTEGEVFDFGVMIDKKSVQLRPFIHSELWLKYSHYKTFMLRNAYLFAKGIQNNNLEPWYEDLNVFNLYLSVVGEYKLDDYTMIGGFQIIVGLMEEIIVLEMRSCLEGKKLSDEIISHSLKVIMLSNNTMK